VIEAADNKFRTYTLLHEHGISIPETVSMENYVPGSDAPLAFPFILKPRVGGASSKNVHLIKDAAGFARVCADPSAKIENLVAQAYIEGDEYTCGTVTVDGRHIGSIVMRRTLRDGDTYKCFTVRNPRIEAEIAKVVAAVKPQGALNIQLRVDSTGQPHIFELNARCSGTTGARALAGFNEPKMIADYYLKGIEPSFDIKELSILRYWKELVVENERVEIMTKEGHLEATNPPAL
jgi:carbamoyl-phosphate synthase large subunit